MLADNGQVLSAGHVFFQAEDGIRDRCLGIPAEPLFRTRRRLRSFAASWLLNALLRIFAMSIITPKRKVLRMSVQDCWRPPLRSDERFSRNAETDIVCRLLLEKKKHRLAVSVPTHADPP